MHAQNYEFRTPSLRARQNVWSVRFCQSPFSVCVICGWLKETTVETLLRLSDFWINLRKAKVNQPETVLNTFQLNKFIYLGTYFFNLKLVVGRMTRFRSSRCLRISISLCRTSFGIFFVLKLIWRLPEPVTVYFTSWSRLSRSPKLDLRKHKKWKILILNFQPR